METNQNKVDSIYEMNLNDEIKVSDNLYVTRVPGGWIYQFHRPAASVLEVVFVPYSGEFCKKEKLTNKTY